MGISVRDIMEVEARREKKMNGTGLVNLQIPADEIENVGALRGESCADG